MKLFIEWALILAVALLIAFQLGIIEIKKEPEPTEPCPESRCWYDYENSGRVVVATNNGVSVWSTGVTSNIQIRMPKCGKCGAVMYLCRWCQEAMDEAERAMEGSK